jgi:hypothetical protein
MRNDANILNGIPTGIKKFLHIIKKYLAASKISHKIELTEFSSNF